MDGFLSLASLSLAVYFLVWKDIVQPLLGLDKRAKPVKSSPPLRVYRKRSRVRNVSNDANAGSTQQHAKREVQNVPANVPGSAPSSAQIAPLEVADGVYVLSQNELQQLATALASRAGGATEAEAIRAGFGASKGGGPAYRRAKELFDAATKAP
jgi:hypothetical protein